MHPIVRARIAWFSDEGHALRGVVHVGANDGREVAWYLHRNHRPVLAFEPHPEPFAELRTIYGDGHGVICVNAALGDADGELTLQVPQDGDTERSSKYAPIPTEGEAHEWTKVPQAGAIEVPLRRFDSWAAETCIDLSPFDVLVIDVQGMELEVLHGMGRCLDGFRYLCVECSERPMYDGEAPAQEVVDWLAAQGFEQQTPATTEDESAFHDDVLFLRVRESALEPREHAIRPGAGATELTITDHHEPDTAPHPPLNEWAKENGWKGRGPIPRAVREAYAETFPA